jgi:Uncharacterised protein family (UPF0259)
VPGVKISTESIWDEMMALMRDHQQVIIAVAGVFIFLPALASGLFMDPLPMGKTPEQVMKGVTLWLQTNWIAIGLQLIVSIFGGVALYRHLLAKRPISAADAIVGSVPILLFVFLANLGTSFIIVVGLNLFVLPGLYVAGRLFFVSPVIVARDEKNILAAVTESFRLTRDNGWRLIGMAMTMILVILVAMLTLSMLLGTIAGLLAPVGVLKLITVFMQAAQATLWTVGGIVMAAAAYRIATRVNV